MSFLHFSRWLLAMISVGVFMIIVPGTAKRYLTTPGLSVRQYDFISRNFEEQKIHIPNRPYNNLTNGGIQTKLNLSSNIFQVALLLSAALAGLLIAKDNEARLVLGRAPEIAMFICAGLLILLSFASHILYLNEISNLYFLAGQLYEDSLPSMPDVSDDNVNFLLAYQIKYLLSGALLAFFTFFSAHILKKE
jgi:hypothetical protein